MKYKPVRTNLDLQEQEKKSKIESQLKITRDEGKFWKTQTNENQNGCYHKADNIIWQTKQES